VSLNIYLTFNGNCASAFDFYKSVFGGDYAAHQTFANAPDNMQIPASEKNKIMHVSLAVGSSKLMGSDTLGEDVNIGQNFAISYAPASRENADELFAGLSEGGLIKMPLQDTFWGSYYGQLQDKFGINWMFNMDTQV
jgi:PhnB protein